MIVTIIAIILLVVGVVLAFVPMVPAVPYMFLVALIYGLYSGFAALSVNGLLVLLGIALASLVVDHTAGLFGAKYGGAHAKSLLFGFIGALAGTFLFPGIGSFAGLFIGVFAGEIYYKKRHDQALRAASGALIGRVIGMGINIVLASAFLITFTVLVLS